jgi:hypothetical protein
MRHRIARSDRQRTAFRFDSDHSTPVTVPICSSANDAPRLSLPLQVKRILHDRHKRGPKIDDISGSDFCNPWIVHPGMEMPQLESSHFRQSLVRSPLFRAESEDKRIDAIANSVSNRAAVLRRFATGAEAARGSDDSERPNLSPGARVPVSGSFFRCFFCAREA